MKESKQMEVCLFFFFFAFFFFSLWLQWWSWSFQFSKMTAIELCVVSFLCGQSYFTFLHFFGHFFVFSSQKHHFCTHARKNDLTSCPVLFWFENSWKCRISTLRICNIDCKILKTCWLSTKQSVLIRIFLIHTHNHFSSRQTLLFCFRRSIKWFSTIYWPLNLNVPLNVKEKVDHNNFVVIPLWQQSISFFLVQPQLLPFFTDMLLITVF